MGDSKSDEKKNPTPPPDSAEGHNSLEDADEASEELEKKRDGEGYAGFGDIG